MIAPLTIADFSSLVDHAFAVTVGTEQVTLALCEVATLNASRPDIREGFSLLFRGPAAPALRQGTYDFAHPVLGAVSIFIVPVGADATGRRYEAIFN